MIKAAIKGTLGLAALLAIAYVVCFVPLGERTLWEHLTRVAATDEAQELGREAAAAGQRLGEEARERLGEMAAHPDAGAATPEISPASGAARATSPSPP